MVVRSTVSRTVNTSVRSTLGSGGGASGGGGGDPLLLDTYTGASAAYSLRKLRNAYTGNCIRIRRSSDSTEQDIGFASGLLDTASLLTFCGAGDGFVTSWYDQSGNEENAVQATTTQQPKIVASGSLIFENEKPAIRFNDSGANTLLARTFSSPYAQPCRWFCVAAPSNITSAASYTIGSATATVSLRHSPVRVSSSTWRTFAGGDRVYSPNIPSTGQYIINSLVSATSSTLRANATAYTGSGTAGTNAANGLAIGGTLAGAVPFIGTIQEVLLFGNQDRAADHTDIESAINAHWSIYA